MRRMEGRALVNVVGGDLSDATSGTLPRHPGLPAATAVAVAIGIFPTPSGTAGRSPRRPGSSRPGSRRVASRSAAPCAPVSWRSGLLGTGEPPCTSAAHSVRGSRSKPGWATLLVTAPGAAALRPVDFTSYPARATANQEVVASFLGAAGSFEQILSSFMAVAVAFRALTAVTIRLPSGTSRPRGVPEDRPTPPGFMSPRPTSSRCSARRVRSDRTSARRSSPRASRSENSSREAPRRPSRGRSLGIAARLNAGAWA